MHVRKKYQVVLLLANKMYSHSYFCVFTDITRWQAPIFTIYNVK